MSTLASLLAPVAVAGIQSLGSFLTSLIFSDYKDVKFYILMYIFKMNFDLKKNFKTTMFGRMMRVKECGENNCIQITDKQSNLVGKGTGASKQEGDICKINSLGLIFQIK